MDEVEGLTFVTVGHDSHLKIWSCPEPIDGIKSEPVHSVALDGIAYSVSHIANSTDFALCGEGIQIWKCNRYIFSSSTTFIYYLYNIYIYIYVT